MYLSFIQHKCFEIVCSQGVTFSKIKKNSLSNIGLRFKDPKLVYLRSFEMNRQQIYRGYVFTLDEWEACLYTIIPSLLLSDWVCNWASYTLDYVLHKVCGCYFCLFFMFSNFYWLFLHAETCVVVAKYMMKYQQTLDWKSHLVWFSYDYRKCMFANSLIEYLCLPNYVNYRVWSTL